jgi:C4-type Zn-finger protein
MIEQIQSAFEPTCPNCESKNVRSNIEAAAFPYGVPPDTVTLQAVTCVYECQECFLRYTDMEGEQAREVAVQDHLRLKARGWA